MKRLIILIIILTPLVMATGQSAYNQLEAFESNANQSQDDIREAVTTSSTRLFSEQYDITTVILLIPKDSLIYVFSADEDYLFVEYQGVQGFIFNRDILYLEPVRQPQQQVVQQQNQVQYQQQVQQQQVQQQYSDPQPDNSLSSLYARYGRSVGDKVYAGKIWRGMTSDMVFDSWGQPLRINEVNKRGMVMQEWIYRNTWLYLENGILLEWGPTRRR